MKGLNSTALGVYGSETWTLNKKIQDAESTNLQYSQETKNRNSNKIVKVTMDGPVTHVAWRLPIHKNGKDRTREIRKKPVMADWTYKLIEKS